MFTWKAVGSGKVYTEEDTKYLDLPMNLDSFAILDGDETILEVPINNHRYVYRRRNFVKTTGEHLMVWLVARDDEAWAISQDRVLVYGKLGGNHEWLAPVKLLPFEV